MHSTKVWCMAFTFVCFTCMAQVEADASAPRRKYRVVYVLAITCLRLSPDGSLTDFQRAVLALFVLLACLGLCRCLVGSFILFGSHALLARVAAASRRNNFREASREDWFVVSPTACQATPRPCKWKRVDSRARQSFALRRRGSGWRHQLLPNYRNCRPPVARPFHTQPWSARGATLQRPTGVSQQSLPLALCRLLREATTARTAADARQLLALGRFANSPSTTTRLNWTPSGGKADWNKHYRLYSWPVVLTQGLACH